MATVTVKTRIDDVTGEALGDEYYELVMTPFRRNGEGGEYVRGTEQRVLDVAPETVQGFTEVGTTRAVRGRKAS